MTKFITPYNGLNKKVGIEFLGESLTDQSAKNECDIGFIIENFVRTGQLPEKPEMNYMDCTTVQSFEEAQMLVAETKTAFELLPAEERDQYKTVQGWLSYINDPANLDDCVKKGYIAADSIPVKEVEKTPSVEAPSNVSDASIETVNANS